MDDQPVETPLQKAQNRLARAAAAMPMHPTGAAISAYVNSTLATARLDALCELYINPPNASFSREEALAAAVTRHLNARATQLESEAHAARTRPKIEVPQGVNGAVRRILAN